LRQESRSFRKETACFFELGAQQLRPPFHFQNDHKADACSEQMKPVLAFLEQQTDVLASSPTLNIIHHGDPVPER
jgi:hypothetical protein